MYTQALDLPDPERAGLKSVPATSPANEGLQSRFDLKIDADGKI